MNRDDVVRVLGQYYTKEWAEKLTDEIMAPDKKEYKIEWEERLSRQFVILLTSDDDINVMFHVMGEVKDFFRSELKALKDDIISYIEHGTNLTEREGQRITVLLDEAFKKRGIL